MENVVFLIVHHATEEVHTHSLIRCVKSVRNHYPTNPIFICKTSISYISDDIITKYNINVHNTPCDGSHIYGGMLLLQNIGLSDTTNYFLMHDSMFLRNKLPESILTKRIYPLWYYIEEGKEHLYYNRMIEKLDRSNCTVEERRGILNSYNNPMAKYGLFGPAFGGNIHTLRFVTYKLGLSIDSVQDFCGRPEIHLAERYLPLVFTCLNVYDIFPETYALDGNIQNQPYPWVGTLMKENLEDIESIIKGYNSYLFKIWVERP